jgi:cytochrome c oxidase cbb3-type subunit 4
MDINIIRGLLTALLIIIFIALYFWAFSKKRKAGFDEAANLPFVGDDSDETIIQQTPAKGKNHE